MSRMGPQTSDHKRQDDSANRLVTEKARAKVNLGLRVFGKREDGYHEVETVMIPIDWSDSLTFARHNSVVFTCTDASLPTDDRNLCVKAARLLNLECQFPGAKIHLEKEVPYGAGLGSGSSDAAATLRGLRTLWQLELSDDDLEQVAEQIGSDVPFFVRQRPARAFGRGTDLRPVDVELNGWIVVVVPPVHVATSEAYAWLGRDQLAPGENPKKHLQTQVSLIAENKNDFEQIIAERYPAVRDSLSRLRATSATNVMMSGSGSAIFGIFADEKSARQAVALPEFENFRKWMGNLSIDL